jgi:hypothetical protein
MGLMVDWVLQVEKEQMMLQQPEQMKMGWLPQDAVLANEQT